MSNAIPRRSWLAVVLGATLLNACVTRTVNSASELAPAMVVERFLRAANSNDLDTMARLFGTRDGPIANRESQKDADDWMFALASVLRHTDYQIMSEQIVPGRRQEATQLLVRLVNGERRYELPFTLVQSKRTGWLIENVPVDLLTNRRGK
ncbi:MAG: hypothetical protein FIB01_02235 [Gemmatimonadetes bacterium]|nr:hypothetical protein [Gemmatimonadota bacterium]